MFFLTYLRRELRDRMRQAVVIAAGLAVGVGLVIGLTKVFGIYPTVDQAIADKK